MKRISIHISYDTACSDDSAADKLYQEYQRRFKEEFSDAKLAGVHIEKRTLVSAAEQVESPVN